MRIATSELYSSSVSTMENQSAQLLTLEQEISSGNALTSPASDPVAAAQAVQLSSTSATLTQYSTNQNQALDSLQTEGNALTSVTGVLQSLESLIQESMSGGLNDTNRAAVAQQMEGYRNELMSLANTTDGEGNMVFAGFQNVSQVFTNNPGGGVTYNGDAGQRSVQVTDTRDIPVSDNGASVFMSVQSLGSQSVPLGNAANTGTATIGAATVTNPTATTNNDNYSISFATATADPTNQGTGALGAVTVTDATATTNNDTYTINFVPDPTTPTQLDYTVTDTSTVPPTTTQPTAYTSGAPIALGSGLSTSISGAPVAGDSFSASQAGGAMYYTVTDNSIPATPPATGGTVTGAGLYTSGAAIALGSGLSTTISGTPATGDTFSVTPATAASNTDVFASLDSMIAALQNPAQGNPTALATMTNALSTGLAQIGNTLSNVTTIQASVGGREQELQSLQTVTSTNALQVTTNLTNLTSVNVASTISQFTQVQNALTASQKTFTETQGLSLFQYFNPS